MMDQQQFCRSVVPISHIIRFLGALSHRTSFVYCFGTMKHRPSVLRILRQQSTLNSVEFGGQAVNKEIGKTRRS